MIKTMNQRLKLAFTFAVIFFISGCDSNQSQSDFKIDQLFGYKFGEVASFAPDKYLVDNQTIEAVNPDKENPFTDYKVTVTPIKHKIYVILANSDTRYSAKECIKEIENIAEKLIAKYGDGPEMRVTNNNDSWQIKENNLRSINMACVENTKDAISPDKNYQLSLVAQDKDLSMEAFKAWQDRQLSDEKFENQK